MGSTNIFWSSIAAPAGTRERNAFFRAGSLGSRLRDLLRNRARSRLSVEVQCSPVGRATQASPALHQRAEADGSDVLASAEAP